jgi:hypothetical protein
MSVPNEKLINARFYPRIELIPECGCWIWTGNWDKDGYGNLFIKRKKYLAHRLSWELHKGIIPIGMFVLHRCDTPSCVNPNHLFIGTRRDNIADCVKKDRDSKGEKHYPSKLTEKDVLSIRADPRNQPTLAIEFKVDQSIISKIKSRKIWRHI